MIETLHTVERILGKVLAEIDTWTDANSVRPVPKLALKRRAFLRQQIGQAKALTVVARQGMPTSDTIAPLRWPIMWAEVETIMQDLKRRDTSLVAMQINLGEGVEWGIPLQMGFVTLECSLKELGL